VFQQAVLHLNKCQQITRRRSAALAGRDGTLTFTLERKNHVTKNQQH
jgi:hypothetical protein